MGDNGIALVATTSAVARDGLFCGRVRVSLYDFESEQFQEPHWFEFPDSRVSDVRVHAFRGGRYHIIWKESPASQSPSRPPQRLHSAAYDPQSGWSEPIEIVTAPKSSMGRHSHIGDVDAAATRDGYLTVTWERFRNVTDDAEGIIHVAEFIPELGEWSEPEIVAQGVYDNRVRNVFRPRIEVSDSGWRLVTWQTLVEPRGVVWARTRLPGGEWSASVRVNPPDRPLISGDGGPHEYAIAMNPHGDAVAVWATPSSPQTHGELWGRRLPANGEWSPQVVKLARNRKQTDSQEGDAVTHASVTVHISEGGRVHAALPGLSDTTCLSYWGVADSQPTVDCDLMSVPAASESPVPSRVLFREGPNETKRAFTTRHQASGDRGTSHGLVGFGFW